MNKLPKFDIYLLDQKGECRIEKDVTTSQLAGQISLITHSIGEVVRITPTPTAKISEYITENIYDTHQKGLKYDTLKKDYDKLKTLNDQVLAQRLKAEAQRDELLEILKDVVYEIIEKHQNSVSLKTYERVIKIVKSIKSITKSND